MQLIKWAHHLLCAQAPRSLQQPLFVQYHQVRLRITSQFEALRPCGKSVTFFRVVRLFGRAQPRSNRIEATELSHNAYKMLQTRQPQTNFSCRIPAMYCNQRVVRRLPRSS